jgi:hypothetical protein
MSLDMLDNRKEFEESDELMIYMPGPPNAPLQDVIVRSSYPTCQAARVLCGNLALDLLMKLVDHPER